MSCDETRTDIENALNTFIGKAVIFSAFILVTMGLLALLFRNKHSILHLLFSGSGWLSVIANIGIFAYYYLESDTA